MASLDEKKLRYSTLRPLTPSAAMASLEKAYDIELTYSSNAIEGNTLSWDETAAVIAKGSEIGGKSLREHFEAVDHFDAMRFTRRLAQGTDRLDEAAVLKLHQIVLSHSQPETAGQYGKLQRGIKGSPVKFPAPDKIPAIMKGFSRWLSDQENTPATAFEAHYKLVTIHPFDDGNGRTARLLMNLMLLRGGYPPVVIGPEQRYDYMNGLQQAQVRNSRAAYNSFMDERLHASLDQHITALEAASQRISRPKPLPKPG